MQVQETVATDDIGEGGTAARIEVPRTDSPVGQVSVEVTAARPDGGPYWREVCDYASEPEG